MLKKIFSCGAAAVLFGNAAASVPNSVEGTFLKAAETPVYSLIAPPIADVISHSLAGVRKYAESMPSISAQNLYDHVKALRFEAGSKEEVDMYNTIMSYFRIQSNSQSGDTVRKKLAELSEALLWLENKAAGRLTGDNLTDFHMVQYLIGNDVFAHLPVNKMKMVLDAAKQYKDQADQAIFMDKLANQHGGVDLHVLDAHLLDEDHQIYDHIQALSVSAEVSQLSADQLDAEIIDQQNQLNQLSKGTYTLNGKQYPYTRTMRKHLKEIIETRLAALFSRRNSLPQE